MAKKDRVDSVAAHEAVNSRPMGVDTANEPASTAATSLEQLHLIPPPLPEEMVQQILERQAVFGF
jgi:hypothetical protein